MAKPFSSLPGVQEIRRLRKERDQKLGLKPKQGRFPHKRTPYKGMMFGSADEAKYAQKLDMLKLAYQIVDWDQPRALGLDECLTCRVQPLMPCRTKQGAEMAGYHRKRLTYKPDFWVWPMEGNSYYIEFKAKGVTETPIYKRKIVEWRKNVPMELRVTYRDGSEKVIATGDECRRPLDRHALQAEDQHEAGKSRVMRQAKPEATPTQTKARARRVG